MGRRRVSVTLSILFFLGVVLALARPAYAYADPGSGLLAVQYLLSLAGGAAFYFRRSLTKLFRLRPRPAIPDKK